MKMMNLLAVVMGLAASISCFAQGGGSVNGPDLKGNMIPVYSDGEIPTQKLNTALETCYKRMGASVLETILGRAVTLGDSSSYPTQDAAMPDSSPAPVTKGEKTLNISYATGSDESPSINIRKSDAIRMKPQTNENYYYHFWITNYHPYEKWENNFNSPTLYISYSFENNGHTDDKKIALISKNFPFISYELKDKSVYGELGELIDKKFFVSNIHFNYRPGISQTVFPLMAIRPDGTEATSPISVDSLDLIQCIKSNLAQ